MTAKSSQRLKALNVKWLVMLAALDVVLVLFFVAPELIDGMTLTKLAVMRALGTSVLPVVVLLLTGWLPDNVKAMLVFWKVTNPLPGSNAFTKYGPADPRINMAVLRKNVGAFPTDSVEQNTKWYALYKLVTDDAAIVEAHKLFLMYRDMAAMSVPLIALVPIGLLYAGASALEGWVAAAIFLVQYLITALNGRHSGVRFVCNVLAAHSTTKVVGAKGAR